MKTIQSASNPSVRRLAELRKRRHRMEQQRIIIEGAPEVQRAIEAGLRIEAAFVTDEVDPHVVSVAESVVRLTGAAADRAFVRERGGQVVVIAEPPALDVASLPATDFAVLAESIEKPGNLGAMLRSADAAGVGAFLVCNPTVDPLNPNVIRASLGAVFTVPLAVCSLAEGLGWCSRLALPVTALDPAGTPLFHTDLTGPSAIAVGAEHAGISAELRAEAATLGSIPMAGSVDSLNAATALAIGLFEVVRQRS